MALPVPRCLTDQLSRIFLTLGTLPLRPTAEERPLAQRRGTFAGLSHWEPALQEWLWAAAPPLCGLSGRPGPSSHLWGRASGSPPGPRTKRLSNFLASVMWTQLSFSTTLMCFTSSLNLGQAHGRNGHDAGQLGPDPAGLQAHRTCAGAKALTPGPHLLLPPQPGPASNCLCIHPAGHLVCLKPKLPGGPGPGPQSPTPVFPAAPWRRPSQMLLAVCTGDVPLPASPSLPART